MTLRSLTDLLKRSPKQNKVLKALRNKVFVQAMIAVQTVIIAVVLICGMSAAWYTNVVQTSGLQFEAANWGFTGQVVVNPENLQAMPGDTGVVDITIQNSGEAMSDVTVYANKGNMDPEMAKRIYFYVDTMAYRNGEAMSRAYVSASAGYTYTVLPGTQLTLTEDTANGAVLKWQWVYDMLGYYFSGSLDAEGKIVTQEILRPVEYDLDMATFDETGMLLTVDGTTAVADFLAGLATTDGYEGTQITPWTESGYYQVAVDESGKGIWLYLCNWNDILAATAYDTALSQPVEADQTKPVYTAVVSMTGQATNLTYTTVTDVTELTQALNAGETVQLQQDLVLTEPLSITAADAVLDLNGKTISVGQDYTDKYLLDLKEGSQLFMMNGKITSDNSSVTALNVAGSNVTMSAMAITGTYDGILVTDDQQDSCVRLVGCTMDVRRCAIQVRGNGTLTDKRSIISIEDCNLKGGYFGINGSGNAVSWGVDMIIARSTVEGFYAGIYQPQDDSTTTITDSTVSGITGIALKAGELLIHNSKIVGTGFGEQITEPSYQGSGFSDTGDALYLEDSYNRDMIVRISGDETELTSAAGLAVRVFAENSSYADVQITGGSYCSDVSEFVVEGYVYADGKVTVKEVAANE